VDLNALRSFVRRRARRSGVKRDAVRFRVDVRHDDLDLLADLHHLFRMLDALHREVRGVDQAVDTRFELDERAKRLEARGVAVRPYFLPIHLQPYMRERFDYREGDFPVTEDLGKRGLAVPFSGVMTEEQVEDVCADLRAEVVRE
jgi:hypothetical protein